MTGNLFLFAGDQTEEIAARKTAFETQLIERVRRGDEEAFGELYKIYAPLVHGVVLARAPRGETDDIVQDVFLSAYENISRLRDGAALGAWLAAIARNRATQYYRQAKPTAELPENLCGTDRPAAEAGEILAAIRALPDSYRETLILRLVEGMTGDEIARQTGLTPASVRVNLHRGMRMLRKKLGVGE